jgi:hypothetical protein
VANFKHGRSTFELIRPATSFSFLETGQAGKITDPAQQAELTLM